ncbi:MAG: hypothetical protein JF887_08995 [Candidatus Dormibacteraeota bacterium]|uniref:Uncharacterized protein n=1 Tax=Candidatus Amunia macphersoniae TaxID=3127014 RepID=A0A934NGP4_9BACT|nr:hypothetical protein [Candidatus Dormibacteraeota bacterium]
MVQLEERFTTVRGMDRVTPAEVEEAGHGWTDWYIGRRLELITAFLGDHPLALAPTPAQVA